MDRVADFGADREVKSEHLAEEAHGGFRRAAD
jgi:hypothetical protein